MFNLNPYLKAVTGALIAGLAPLITAEVASPHAITLPVGLTALGAFLTALYGVFATTNTPKATALTATVVNEPTTPVASPALPPLPPIAQPEGFMGGS